MSNPNNDSDLSIVNREDERAEDDHGGVLGSSAVGGLTDVSKQVETNSEMLTSEEEPSSQLATGAKPAENQESNTPLIAEVRTSLHQIRERVAFANQNVESMWKFAEGTNTVLDDFRLRLERVEEETRGTAENQTKILQTLETMEGALSRLMVLQKASEEDQRIFREVVEERNKHIESRVDSVRGAIDQINENLAKDISRRPLMNLPTRSPRRAAPEAHGHRTPRQLESPQKVRYVSASDGASGDDSSVKKKDQKPLRPELANLYNLITKNPPPRYCKMDSREFPDFIEKLREYCTITNKDSCQAMKDELSKLLDTHYNKMFESCVQSGMTFEEIVTAMSEEIQKERKRIPEHYITVFENLHWDGSSLSMYASKIESAGKRYLSAKRIPQTEREKIFCEKIRASTGARSENLKTSAKIIAAAEGASQITWSHYRKACTTLDDEDQQELSIKAEFPTTYAAKLSSPEMVPVPVPAEAQKKSAIPPNPEATPYDPRQYYNNNRDRAPAEMGACPLSAQEMKIAVSEYLEKRRVPVYKRPLGRRRTVKSANYTEEQWTKTPCEFCAGPNHSAECCETLHGVCHGCKGFGHIRRNCPVYGETAKRQGQQPKSLNE